MSNERKKGVFTDNNNGKDLGEVLKYSDISITTTTSGDAICTKAYIDEINEDNLIYDDNYIRTGSTTDYINLSEIFRGLTAGKHKVICIVSPDTEGTTIDDREEISFTKINANVRFYSEYTSDTESTDNTLLNYVNYYVELGQSNTCNDATIKEYLDDNLIATKKYKPDESYFTFGEGDKGVSDDIWYSLSHGEHTVKIAITTNTNDTKEISFKFKKAIIPIKVSNVNKNYDDITNTIPTVGPYIIYNAEEEEIEIKSYISVSGFEDIPLESYKTSDRVIKKEIQIPKSALDMTTGNSNTYDIWVIVKTKDGIESKYWYEFRKINSAPTIETSCSDNLGGKDKRFKITFTPKDYNVKDKLRVTATIKDNENTSIEIYREENIITDTSITVSVTDDTLNSLTRDKEYDIEFEVYDGVDTFKKTIKFTRLKLKEVVDVEVKINTMTLKPNEECFIFFNVTKEERKETEISVKLATHTGDFIINNTKEGVLFCATNDSDADIEINKFSISVYTDINLLIKNIRIIQ